MLYCDLKALLFWCRLFVFFDELWCKVISLVYKPIERASLILYLNYKRCQSLCVMYAFWVLPYQEIHSLILYLALYFLMEVISNVIFNSSCVMFSFCLLTHYRNILVSIIEALNPQLAVVYVYFCLLPVVLLLTFCFVFFVLFCYVFLRYALPVSSGQISGNPPIPPPSPLNLERQPGKPKTGGKIGVFNNLRK